MKTIFCLATATLAAGTAFAGWTSSGGRILSDAENPWWVHNTSDVNYCVVVDAASVSVPEERIDRAFQSALVFWRSQLTESQWVTAPLVTQRFAKVACDGGAAVDLKLKVGAGSLDAAERGYFGDRLPFFAAVAVRTEYDEVNLRGKGFIYVAGDRDDRSRPAWSDDGKLERVFAHEMGHVFGLPHIAKTLMDEGGPEAWLKGGGWVRHPEIPDFVRSPLFPRNCSMAARSRVFAGQSSISSDADFACLIFQPVEGLERTYRVLGKQLLGNSAPVVLGTLAPRAGLRSSGSFNLVRIFLNPRQTVFPPDQTLATNLVGHSTNEAPYLFSSVEGWSKPFYLHGDMLGAEMYTAETQDFLGTVGEAVLPALQSSRSFGDWWGED